MNRHYKACVLMVGMSLITQNAFSLTLDEYLAQVMDKHEGVKSARMNSEGAGKRSEGGNLIFSTRFFAQADYTDDQRITAAPAFQGTQTRVRNYEAGFSKKFDFGMDASLSYKQSRYQLKGVDTNIVRFFDYYDNRPQLQLSQSLWRNWLGKESQATANVQNKQAEALKFDESFRAKSILAEAENAYWNVVQARSFLAVQKETVNRAEKINGANERKTRLQLTDRIDLLQSSASLDFRRLQLQNAEQNLQKAERYFNRLRGDENFAVSDELSNIQNLNVAMMTVPPRVDVRDDVKAALARTELTKSQVELAIEQTKPTLEVFGTLSTNGRDNNYSKSYDQGMTDKYTNNSIGIRFNAPLDFGLVRDTADGYKMQEVAARHDYNRKKFDQDREYDDLVRRFEDTKARLGLAQKIREAQERKLTYERTRGNKGLTTTFQVLTFEQDFNDSEIELLNAETQLVNLYTQLKLFSP